MPIERRELSVEELKQRDRLARVLFATDQNQSEAARRLGVSTKTVQRLVKKYELKN